MAGDDDVDAGSGEIGRMEPRSRMAGRIDGKEWMVIVDFGLWILGLRLGRAGKAALVSLGCGCG